MSRRLGLLSGFIAVLLMAATASASPILATYDRFGTLAGATFGGSGIPNNWVAISTILDGENEITLGLTATGRFANPPVSNNGAGTFTALQGGDLLNAAPALARWNFDFYVSQSGGNYTYDLLYDFDPAAGTDQSALGKISFSAIGPFIGQNSWNLGFGFLAGGPNPPTFPSFDPNAAGEYSFALIVRDQATQGELDRSAIQVNAVPEPASITLLATGLAGLLARRRKKIQAGN